MSREDFVCLLLWEDFVPGGFCVFFIAGGFYTGRQMSREDFVSLLSQEDFVWEDFVLGGFFSGRILCVL